MYTSSDEDGDDSKDWLKAIDNDDASWDDSKYNDMDSDDDNDSKDSPKLSWEERDEAQREAGDRVSDFAEKRGLAKILQYVLIVTILVVLLLGIAGRSTEGIVSFVLYRLASACFGFAFVFCGAFTMHVRLLYRNYKVRDRKYIWFTVVSVIISVGVTYYFGMDATTVYTKLLPFAFVLSSTSSLLGTLWLLSRRHKYTRPETKAFLWGLIVIFLSLPFGVLVGYFRLNTEQKNSIAWLDAVIGVCLAAITFGCSSIFGLESDKFYENISHMRRSGRTYMQSLYLIVFCPSMALVIAYIDPSFVRWRGERDGQDIGAVGIIVSVSLLIIFSRATRRSAIKLIGGRLKMTGVIFGCCTLLAGVPFFAPMPYFKRNLRNSLVFDVIAAVTCMLLFEGIWLVAVVLSLSSQKALNDFIIKKVEEMYSDDDSEDSDDDSREWYEEAEETRVNACQRTVIALKSKLVYFLIFLKNPMAVIRPICEPIFNVLKGSPFAQRWRVPSCLYVFVFVPAITGMGSLSYQPRVFLLFGEWAVYIYGLCIMLASGSGIMIIHYALYWNRSYRRRLPRAWQIGLRMLYISFVVAGPSLYFRGPPMLKYAGFVYGISGLVMFVCGPIAYDKVLVDIAKYYRSRIMAFSAVVLFPGVLGKAYLNFSDPSNFSLAGMTTASIASNTFLTFSIFSIVMLYALDKFVKSKPILQQINAELLSSLQDLKTDVEDIADLQSRMKIRRNEILSKSSRVENNFMKLVEEHNNRMLAKDSVSVSLTKMIKDGPMIMAEVASKVDARSTAIRVFRESNERRGNGPWSQEKLRKGIEWVSNCDSDVGFAAARFRRHVVVVKLQQLKLASYELAIHMNIAKALQLRSEAALLNAQSNFERSGTLGPTTDNMQLLARNAKGIKIAEKRFKESVLLAETSALEFEVSRQEVVYYVANIGESALEKRLLFVQSFFDMHSKVLEFMTMLKNNTKDETDIRAIDEAILGTKSLLMYATTVKNAMTAKFDAWVAYRATLESRLQLIKNALKQPRDQHVHAKFTKKLEEYKPKLQKDAYFRMFNIENDIINTRNELEKKKTLMKDLEMHLSAPQKLVGNNEKTLEKLREQHALKKSVLTKKQLDALYEKLNSLNDELDAEMNRIELSALDMVEKMFVPSKLNKFRKHHVYGSPLPMPVTLVETCRAILFLRRREFLEADARKSRMDDSPASIKEFSAKERAEINAFFRQAKARVTLRESILRFTDNAMKTRNTKITFSLDPLDLFETTKKEWLEMQMLFTQEIKQPGAITAGNFPASQRDDASASIRFTRGLVKLKMSLRLAKEFINQDNFNDKINEYKSKLNTGIKVLRQAEGYVDDLRSQKNARLANLQQELVKARDKNFENWNRAKSESHFIVIGLTFIADSIQTRLGTMRSNMFYIFMQYLVLLPLIVSLVFFAEDTSGLMNTNQANAVSGTMFFGVLCGISLCLYLFEFSVHLIHYKMTKTSIGIAMFLVLFIFGDSLLNIVCAFSSACHGFLNERHLLWLSILRGFAPVYCVGVLAFSHWRIRLETKLIALTSCFGAVPISIFLPRLQLESVRIHSVPHIVSALVNSSVSNNSAFISRGNPALFEQTSKEESMLFLFNIPLAGVVAWIMSVYIDRARRKAATQIEMADESSLNAVIAKKGKDAKKEYTALHLFFELLLFLVVPCGTFLPFHLFDVMIMQTNGFFVVNRATVIGAGIISCGLLLLAGRYFRYRQNARGSFAAEIKNPQTLLWVTHSSASFVIVIGFLLAYTLSLEDRVTGLLASLIGGGVLHTIGNAGMKCREQRSTKILLAVCCLSPLITGIVLTAIFLGEHSSDTVLSLALALMTVLPGASLFWAVIWQTEQFLKSQKNGNLLISGVLSLCCCLCMIPFGFVLPVITSMDFKRHLGTSTALRVTISIISLMVMAIIIVISNIATASFLSLEKERQAKKVVRKIIAQLDASYAIKTKEALLRPLFDVMYDIHEDQFMEYLTYDNPMIHSFDDGKTIKIKDAKILNKDIAQKKIILCKSCVAIHHEYTKAGRGKDLCRPCELEAALETRRGHRKLLELERYASAEKKELIRLQRKRDKIAAMEARKKESSLYSLAKQKVNGSEFTEVVSLATQLIDMNAHNWKYHVLLATGSYSIGNFEMALEFSRKAICLNEEAIEPIVLLFGAACALNQPDEAAKICLARLRVCPLALPIRSAYEISQKLAENKENIEVHAKRGKMCRMRVSVSALMEENVQLRAAAENLAMNILMARQRRRQRRLDQIETEKQMLRVAAMAHTQSLLIAVKLLGVENIPKNRDGRVASVYCRALMMDLFGADLDGKNDLDIVAGEAKQPTILYNTNTLPPGTSDWDSELVGVKHWMFSGNKKLVFQLWRLPNETDEEDTDVCLGSWSVAAFQITRYVREQVYADVPLKTKQIALGLDDIFSVKNKKTLIKKKEAEILMPRLKVCFCKLTEKQVVRYVRQKFAGTILKDSFFAWQSLCGSSSDMVRTTLEEVFVQYSLRHPYVPRHVQKKKKGKKSVSHHRHANNLEALKLKIQEETMRLKYWHDKIMAFYSQTNASKANVAHVDALLAKNRGHERKLFERLHDKYEHDLPDDHVKSSLVDMNKKKKLAFRRAKILHTPGGLAKVLMSPKAFHELLRDSNIMTTNADEVLKNIFERKQKYEKKRLGMHFEEPPKACNFKMFCIALYDTYIRNRGKHYKLKSKLSLANEICYRHIRRGAPMYSKWRTQRRIVREHVRDSKIVYSDDLLSAKLAYRYTSAVRQLQRVYRRFSLRQKSAAVIIRFFQMLVQFSRERAKKEKEELEHEIQSDSEDDEVSDDEIYFDKDNGKNSWHNRILECIRGKEEADGGIEEKGDLFEEDNSQSSNSGVIKKRIQAPQFDVEIAKIVVSNKIGTVFFHEKADEYLVAGQSFICSNFNSGANPSILNRLNGEWPSNEKGNKLGKNIFYILNVDANNEYFRFQTEGLVDGTYIADVANLPNHVFQGGMATVKKTSDSMMEQTKQEKLKHRIPWSSIAEIISSVTSNAREEARMQSKSNDINVDWKATENIMAIYNMYVSRLLMYLSLAFSNGPLADAREESTTTASANITEAAELTSMEYLDIVASIPQMKLPAKYGNTYVYFFSLAVVIAFTFPPFTSRAIRRARKGTMGLGPDGRKAATASKEGMYMLLLNIVSNTFFFGVMVTLVSAFACDYDELMQRFFLTADPGIECFSYDDFTHFAYMIVSGLAIFLFYPLATILIPTFQFMNKGLDIKFSASFVTLEKQTDLGVAIFGAFYSSLSTLAVLLAQFIICLGLAVFNHATAPCLVPYMNIYKTLMYVAAAYITGVVIVWQVTHSYLVLYFLGGFLPLALGICFMIRRYKKRRKLIEKSFTKVAPIDNLNKNNGSVDTKEDVEEVRPAELVSSLSKQQKEKTKLVACPQCRLNASIEKWQFTFVTAECCICLESKRMVISSQCGHGMCSSCFDELNTK